MLTKIESRSNRAWQITRWKENNEINFQIKVKERAINDRYLSINRPS